MRVAKRSDARISVMNELIQGIQVIKVRKNLRIFYFLLLLIKAHFSHHEDVRVGNSFPKCGEGGAAKRSGSNSVGLLYSRNLLVDDGFHGTFNAFHRNSSVYLRGQSYYRRSRFLDGYILQRTSINSCSFLSPRRLYGSGSFGTFISLLRVDSLLTLICALKFHSAF